MFVGVFVNVANGLAPSLVQSIIGGTVKLHELQLLDSSGNAGSLNLRRAVRFAANCDRLAPFCRRLYSNAARAGSILHCLWRGHMGTIIPH
jgi:hypothetical protein